MIASLVPGATFGFGFGKWKPSSRDVCAFPFHNQGLGTNGRISAHDQVGKGLGRRSEGARKCLRGPDEPQEGERERVRSVEVDGLVSAGKRGRQKDDDDS